MKQRLTYLLNEIVTFTAIVLFIIAFLLSICMYILFPITTIIYILFNKTPKDFMNWAARKLDEC
ncbi:hypothetical protein LCGC14_1510850 [marine sediment metagenome]|uniref:Uncharacterized protein n=1 Tax=marine sediment metagenome TaxID=412755 RepID=A0A0F9J1H5_9ZZZZ